MFPNPGPRGSQKLEGEVGTVGITAVEQRMGDSLVCYLLLRIKHQVPGRLELRPGDGAKIKI